MFGDQTLSFDGSLLADLRDIVGCENMQKPYERLRVRIVGFPELCRRSLDSVGVRCQDVSTEDLRISSKLHARI